MVGYSSRQAAQKLGLPVTTPNTSLSTGKIPRPKWRMRLYFWTDGDVERVRELLAKDQERQEKRVTRRSNQQPALSNQPKQNPGKTHRRGRLYHTRNLNQSSDPAGHASADTLRAPDHSLASECLISPVKNGRTTVTATVTNASDENLFGLESWSCTLSTTVIGTPAIAIDLGPCYISSSTCHAGRRGQNIDLPIGVSASEL